MDLNHKNVAIKVWGHAEKGIYLLDEVIDMQKRASVPVRILGPAIYYSSYEVGVEKQQRCEISDTFLIGALPMTENIVRLIIVITILSCHQINRTLFCFLSNFPVHDHLRIGLEWVSSFALISPHR